MRFTDDDEWIPMCCVGHRTKVRHRETNKAVHDKRQEEYLEEVRNVLVHGAAHFASAIADQQVDSCGGTV